MIVQPQHPIPVPFRDTTLYIIEFESNPYTPMKPIVEGMGLSWQGQHEKLSRDKVRWGIKEILIPSAGGPQNALCILMRKLHGWLMTISPNKVKPEIRDTIIAYQNECDDVLWRYWTQGHAVNPRMNLPQDYYSDLRTIANGILAFLDKYTNHATNEPAPDVLTCPHIVNCEQRTQPKLPNPIASTLAVTSPVQPCADLIFLSVLQESLESQPFTANQLHLIIVSRQYPALTDAAVNLLGDIATWSARKLGQTLGRWSRSEFSCYRILNIGSSKNGILWRLERVS